MRHDPLFGSLLAWFALGVVTQLISEAWLSAIVSALTLWGMVTFRWWGYWLAMLFAGLGLAMGLLMVMTGALGGLVPVAMNAFVIAVLYLRRDCFD